MGSRTENRNLALTPPTEYRIFRKLPFVAVGIVWYGPACMQCHRPLLSSRSIAHVTASSTSSVIFVGVCDGVPPRKTPVFTRMDDQPCPLAPAISTDISVAETE
jgi:hypothetical protein